jgi:hypothetical protein
MRHSSSSDAAFKLKGTPAAPKAAPKPAAATQAKPQPKPVARPAPAAKAQPAPKPVAAKPNVSPASAPADPPLGEPKNKSPIDHGLSSAFEDNGSNFTATLTVSRQESQNNWHRRRRSYRNRQRTVLVYER